MDFSQNNFYSVSKFLVGPSSKALDIPHGSKIVHVDFLQSGTASNTWVECGGLQIARNFAKDAEVNLAFTATTTCTAIKTGNDESFVTVIYSTPYATSSLEMSHIQLQSQFYELGVFNSIVILSAVLSVYIFRLWKL